MHTKINWFKAVVLVVVLVFLTDINMALYKHPLNRIPVLKYAIIVLSALLFVMIILNFISKPKRKK